MYETPRLKRVGEAEEVILGFEEFGADMDGCDVGSIFEFAAEEKFDEN